MIKAQNDSLSPSSHKNIKSKTRDLRMESLEERQLLSVSPVSAASDDVDYACIAPAEMAPMESAPVVEINLTDEVPTLDAPVALAADTTAPISFQDYTFTPDGSFTYEENGNTITISAGNVTVTGGSADPVNIVYAGTGTLTVDTDLTAGNSITMNSGALSVVSGRTIADVTSSGCAISGEGTISALNMASGTTTINGGTITAASGSGAVVIEGTTGSDTFTIGQTVTVGTTSVTFDTGCTSNVTINGGAGNDTFNVTAAPTSGSLTLNGGAGTDILSNNTNVALASTGIEITSSASGSVIVVTASSETADTDATISLSEAFAALNAGTLAGDYTLGFTNANYTLDQALTSNYTNTDHKLTIDGTQVYNGVTGAAGSAGTVTVTVGNFTNTDANMTFAAGTTVVIDGLVYTGVTLEQNQTAKNTGVGIYNNGTLTLTGGAKVSNFNNTGIVNNSSNTLIIDDGSVISGNTGHGIQNTSTGTLYLIKGSVIQNGGDGIYNEGTVVIGKADGTGTVDEVLIQENKKGGIDNHSATGNLTVYNGTIKSNISDNIHEQDYGINNYNGGTATLAGATAASIIIENNGTAAQEETAENKGGVRNDVGSTLTVTGATIKINHGDGIFNEGTATIGKADGTGKASDILILSNKSDGIENKEGSAELWIYNATISGQEQEGEYGLYNHSTAVAHLWGHLETVDGEQVPSIIISGHHIGGIVNGFIGPGGIVVDDDDNPSVIDITCVKISDNYRDGVKNAGVLTSVLQIPPTRHSTYRSSLTRATLSKTMVSSLFIKGRSATMPVVPQVLNLPIMGSETIIKAQQSSVTPMVRAVMRIL